jgi:hypothetical protein
MRIAKAVALFAAICALVVLVSRQADSQQSQIREAINPAKLVVLKGNVHPWAQARFDRGPAPANLPMDRMMLVLKSTPEQGAQLEELLREQQDPTSANYHKWLTPEEFGSQFGASEADIQKIASWLTSQGFAIDTVAKGRNLIEFSGNAGQVQATFHAAIHKYVIGGKQYWANENDPAIPEALVPAVAGIASLNNFPRTPESRFAGTFTRNKQGKLVRKASANPEFTYAGGCNGTNTNGTATNCYGLTPYDFATIYDVLPLWTASTPINGSGQTIAIVSDSDINKTDFTNFRSLFGLPAGTLNVIYTPGSSSTNPGATGDEGEADVDTQWSGAVAPGATIDLVVSADTTSTFGGDISAEYIIDNKSTLSATVLGYSYGECEFFLGSAGNLLYGGSTFQDGVSGEWTQAAAEGITVVVSTGDNGSTACEQIPSSPAPSDEPAIYGLAVNGIASTPYNVAVGGTDFNDGPYSTSATCPGDDVQCYWNASNASTTEESVKGYIPEVVYNDSCLNAPLDALYDSSASSDGLTNCNTYFNNSSLGLGPLVVPFGGGGGPSTCIVSNYNPSSDTGTFSGCSQGYAKPTWQTGTGVPSDGVRDLPDISGFAGDGTFQNFYLYCEQDASGSTGACSLAQVSSSSNPFPNIQGVGGTSVSAEVFTGMMALLNQAEGTSGPVGLPNKNLYALAAQSWANCQSSGTLNSGCIFYQITSGSNAMPCVSATTKYGTPPGCSQGSGSSVGTTESNGSPAYQAATGYNLATGLGSLNVYNLVKEWNVGSGGAADFVISASPAAVNVASAGGSGTTTITVVPVNGFSDTVNFSASSCAGLPSGATCSFSSSPVSANGTTTLTIQTSAAGAVPPAALPNEPGAWRTPGIVALGGMLSIAILFFALRGRSRRWGVAAACIIFAAFIGLAGCGGGGSSSVPPPPPPPPPPPAAVVPVAVTITGTSTTGQVSHTTTIMLTVQ